MILSRGSVLTVPILLVARAASAASAAGETPPSDTPAPPRATAPPPSTAPAAPQIPGKIEWRDVFWGDRYGGLLHAEKPYQNGRLLEGEALYLSLARPDLADAYRKRQETQTSLAVGGGIMVVGGAIAAVAAKDDQRNGGGQGLAIGAVISIVLGIVLEIAGASTPDVVTDADLHHLVDVHNSSL